MAAIISMAVGFVGAAVGTAIGAAIGGTILGISAATIGAVIGAGVAGGLLSMARGGDFGKGFLVGAVGAGIGSFASSVFGGAGGAADAAGGMAEGATAAAADGTTTTASMMAAQGGAEFAPDALAAATGDIGQAAATSGIETAGGVAGDTGLNSTVSGMGDTAATAPSLADTTSGSMTTTPQPTPGMDGNMATSTAGGFSGAEAGLPVAQSGGLSSIWDASGASNPSSYSLGASDAGGGGAIEGMGAQGGGMSFDPNQGASVPMESGGSGWSLEGMEKDLGVPKGSAAKLAMGGLDAVMKNYQANKVERQVNKMKPLTFEEFRQQYSNPDDYKVAANQMARSGRTGTLPVLLARMNQNVRGKYASYLPGAQKEDYGRRMDVAGLKTASLNNLFAPYAQNAAMKGSY